MQDNTVSQTQDNPRSQQLGQVGLQPLESRSLKKLTPSESWTLDQPKKAKA